MDKGVLSAEAGLSALRAISEPTRLRILFLLSQGELTVKDLTRILGQSQPRISRHLKLMHDAGLLMRVQEGSWVYFRLTEKAAARQLLLGLLAQFDADDEHFRRDRERADAIGRERFETAQAFFARHADQWDRLRAMHADETEVESRIIELIGNDASGVLVDLGTGTGRVIELLAAKFRRVIGIDLNAQMLACARARIQGAEFSHVQVRQGDICNLSLTENMADTVIMHQVLHYLPEPLRAIEEAARVLKPSGELLIVDFAAHTLDHLRDEFAHQRLGFANAQMATWLEQAGLELNTHQELPPASGTKTDGLTVSFWRATAQQHRSEKTNENSVLEMAQ